MKCYTKDEKTSMVRMYETCGSYYTVAAHFGCAVSTVYYAVNPDKYEHHKEHVYYMREINRKCFGNL